MKILIFSPGFVHHKGGGGVKTFTSWLSQGLANSNISVSVLSVKDDFTDDNIPINQWFEWEGVYVKYIRCRSKTKFPLELLKHMNRNIRDFDLVHLNGFFYPGSLFLYLLCAFNQKRVVWSMHGEFSLQALSYKKYLKRIYKRLVILFLRKDTILHATSNKETHELENNLSNRHQIIEIPILIPIEDEVKVCQGNYLLFLGRIHPIKGIENLLLAISYSKEFSAEKCILVIAGDGDKEYCDYLNNIVESLNLGDQVRFLGRVDGVKKEQLLAEARLLVLPSFSENFGIVVIEALQKGTPVLASRATPWEVLTKWKAGFWVDNSQEELTLSIDNFLEQSSEEVATMRINARKLAESEFSLTRNISLWSSAYKMAVG